MLRSRKISPKAPLPSLYQCVCVCVFVRSFFALDQSFQSVQSWANAPIQPQQPSSVCEGLRVCLPVVDYAKQLRKQKV